MARGAVLDIVQKRHHLLRIEDADLPRNTVKRSAASDQKGLPARIETAMQQGRFAQALELAKTLYAQASSIPHIEILQKSYLALIRLHVDRDAAVDARRYLDEAEKLEISAPSWWAQLAVFRAQIGDVARARQLLIQVPDPKVVSRVDGILVDRAMADRQRGRDLVGPEQRREFDLIRQAFAEYDKGNDEGARQALQGLGVLSPFLEWKLLIRGLIAYSTNDDARALENWSRLDSERLPAKLALPLRCNLDSAYRNSLPTAQANAANLRSGALAHPMVVSLRDLQRLLGTVEDLPNALRSATSVVGSLKIHFPHLVPRLANCFYSLLIQGGMPEDLDRYRRVFGPPQDDKELCRLNAIILEGQNRLDLAHRSWQKYEQEIAGSAERWPGEQGLHARAMVWNRMGDNAQQKLGDDDNDPEFFDEFMDLMGINRGRKKPDHTPLTPDAEECYRKAIALAPNWKTPTSKLVDFLASNDRLAEAEVEAQRFLAAHPDEIEMLVELAELQIVQEKRADAIATLERVVKNNPLDRVQRARLACMHLEQARESIEAGDFERARHAIDETIAHQDGLLGNVARAMAVASADLTGDTACSAAWRASFKSDVAGEAGIAYVLMVEGIRLKVPKGIQKEHQTRFDAALAAPLSHKEIEMLARYLGFYRQEPKPYRGIGPHEKKIVACLMKILDAKPPINELIEFGFLLLNCRISKALLECAKQGLQRDRINPAFQYFQAEQAIIQRPKTFSVSTVGRLFNMVLLATENNPDDRGRQMRDAIEQRRQQFPRLDDAMRFHGFPFRFGGFPF